MGRALFALLAVFAVVVLIGEIGWVIKNSNDNQTNFEQQILHARYDDCLAGNQTRAALRQIAVQQHAQLPLTRKFFPNIPESVFRDAEKRYRSQIKAFAPRDCQRFALQVKP